MVGDAHYKFGFNGKQKDNEVAGVGNHLDYGLRGYDTRIGRFWSVDPLTEKFPYWTPYQFSGLNPIRFNDLDGAEPNDPLTRFFITDAAITLTTEPTSAKARVYGAAMGIGGAVGNAISGVGMMIRHPVQTGQGMLRMATQSPADNAVDYGMNMAQLYGGLPAGAQDAAVKAHVTTDVAMALSPFKFKASPMVRAIETPYGIARQSSSRAAIAAVEQVNKGAALYRVGTLGKSAATEAQFWSLENPANYLNDVNAFAQKYGIPLENLKGGNLFIETGTLKQGAKFITREAPGAGGSNGGSIEVVTGSGNVKVSTFSTIKQ